MKRIETEVQRTETIVTFEATDGQRFKSEQECRQYEDSMKGTIKGMWNDLKKVQRNAEDFVPYCDCGCEDSLYILHPTTETDMNIINAYIDNCDGITKGTYNDLNKDVLVVISCDECWAKYLGTVEKYKAKMMKQFEVLVEDFNKSETESEEV